MPVSAISGNYAQKVIPAATFKASRGLVTCFMRSDRLFLKRTALVTYLIGLHQVNNFVMSQVGKVDEIPLTFDMPPSTTV